MQLSEEDAREAEEWMRSRPPSVQALMRRFPPGCTVRANRPLVCPAPGKVGRVVSYYESGKTVGVLGEDALMGGDVKADCEPGWLEVVECAAPFDHDYVRRVLGDE